jgi:NAD(P)-dependent dehydrogenase (short-subunit alcohol dehydrogenase family)
VKTVLLTGAGDIANELQKVLSKKYVVLNPSKLHLDVTNSKSVEIFFSKLNQLDIVINLAGTLYSSKIVESDVDKWIKDINVNLIGTYLINRRALILNSKVKIINISSTAAFNSYVDWSSYCASKAGVLKISNAIALDGFDVVTLCPGAIDTKLRYGLSINNPNIMTIDEALTPILDTIDGKYSSGDIVFYRKNEFKLIREV